MLLDRCSVALQLDAHVASHVAAGKRAYRGIKCRYHYGLKRAWSVSSTMRLLVFENDHGCKRVWYGCARVFVCEGKQAWREN